MLYSHDMRRLGRDLVPGDIITGFYAQPGIVNSFFDIVAVLYMPNLKLNVYDPKSTYVSVTVLKTNGRIETRTYILETEYHVCD
jgi:hypothetical protein